MRFENNPGNLRHFPANKWLGEKTPSFGFCQFTTPFYGVRAILVTLLSYRKKYGLKSVASIIARYAPPTENDTSGYIKYVCSKTHTREDESLHSFKDYITLIVAICTMETGEEGRILALSVFNNPAELKRLRETFYILTK